MTLNVRHAADADARRATIAWLENQPADADVITLHEFSHDWLAHADALAAAFPHTRVPAPDNDVPAGTVVLSQHPLTNVRVVDTATGEPATIARVAAPQPFTVAALHPLSPDSAREMRARDAYLRTLADTLNDIAGPLIAMGDYNTTPWAPNARAFRDLAELDARSRAVPTFPARLDVLGVPIDGAAGRGVTFRRTRAGPATLSDHRPVIIDVAITSQSGTP